MINHRAIALSSSVLLRISAPAFLRFFPVPHLFTATVALFAIYVPSFIKGLNDPTPRQIRVEDKVNVAVVKPRGENVNTQGRASETAPLVAVQFDETVRIVDKGPSLLSTLLGTPNPRLVLLSIGSLLLNLALTCACVDFVFRSHFQHLGEDLSFVRLGYVSSDEARFLLREPDQAQLPVSFELHIKDPKTAIDNPLWQVVGTVEHTGNETDFTTALRVPLHHAEQRVYEWKTSNGHFGQFAAPPKAGELSQLTDGKFTFLSTSCILPHFPYNPLDHPLTIPGLRHLANLLPSLNAQFMLFLGDFIYIDVPQRMGFSAGDYREKYRQIYASPEWAQVGQNLSWIHVLDDHEIANDWSSNTTGVYSSAIEPFVHYQASVNPPPPKRALFEGTTQNQARYFEFTQGPASFFLTDTRTYRSPNKLPVNSTAKTMLGAKQLDELVYWLSRPEPRGVKWKIIASSVPFTKNWPVNNGDTWGGFLDERQRVLEAMWDAGARGFGVVVLSGDRHEFAATKFPPPPHGKWPESAAAYEFSASPLNQFSSPLPSYQQSDEQDVMIKYIHSGQSKFGALTIEMLEEGRLSSLKYRLFIDGQEAWNTTVLSPPSKVETVKSSLWDKLF